MKMKPISQIKADLGINPGGRVQRFFTDTCYKHMDKYVPLGDTGNLRDIIDKGVDYITYEMPYAHYQYIGKLYVMDNGKGAYYNSDYGFWSKPGAKKTPTDIDLKHNGITSSYWDKKMVSAEMNDVIKEVQEYVNRGK